MAGNYNKSFKSSTTAANFIRHRKEDPNINLKWPNLMTAASKMGKKLNPSYRQTKN